MVRRLWPLTGVLELLLIGLSSRLWQGGETEFVRYQVAYNYFRRCRVVVLWGILSNLDENQVSLLGLLAKIKV